MARTKSRSLAALGLFVGLALMAGAAEPKKADWSGYVDLGTITAEIKKIDKDYTFIEVVTPPGTPQPGVKGPKQQKYNVSFAENGLVRWIKLGKKTDEKGRKTAFSDKERELAKQPRGAPGYAASKSELSSGQIVQITLVRSKDLKPNEVTTNDYKIKYIVIVGEDTDPAIPGDDGSMPEEKPKGKEKEKEKAKAAE